MESQIKIKALPDQSCYAEGTPIVITLNITNNGTVGTVLDLGAEAKEMLQIAVESQEEKIIVPQFVPTGFCILVQIDLPPGETKYMSLLLDEFICLKKPAIYALSIGVMTKDQGLLLALANFEIIPSLQKQLSKLWEEHQNPKSSPERIAYIERYLSFGRNPDFIEYQRYLMSNLEQRSLKVIANVISGLLDSDDNTGLKMIQAAIENGNDRTLRMVALFQLSQMPKDWWTPKKLELFGKFEKEMKLAGPVGVSD